MRNKDSENIKTEKKSHLHIENTQMADLIFTMTLFCIFAICAVFVVIMGAKVYQNTTESMNQNFTARTAVAYVSEKMRQRDIEGSVRVMNIDGTSVLSMVRQYDISSVYSYVYVRDGYLQELTLTGITEPDLSMGSRILKVQNMTAEEISKGLVKIIITGETGEKDTFFLAAKCDDGMEGVPMVAPEGVIAAPGDNDISMAAPELEDIENIGGIRDIKDKDDMENLESELSAGEFETFSEPVRIESEPVKEETE